MVWKAVLHEAGAPSSAGLKDARGSAIASIPQAPSVARWADESVTVRIEGIISYVLRWPSRTRCEIRYPFECRLWVLPVGGIWRCRRVAREELLRFVERNVIWHPQCMLTNCVGMKIISTVSCKPHSSCTRQAPDDLRQICRFGGILIIWYLSAKSIHSIYDPRSFLERCLPAFQWVLRLWRYIRWRTEAQSPQY